MSLTYVATGVPEAVGAVKGARARIPISGRTALTLLSIRGRELLGLRMNAQGPTDKFWGRMGARGDWLGSRTGETRKRLSPAGIVVKQGNKLVCSVGSPDAYVARLEEDSTITSTGKMFRIPTAAAQNGSGQDVNTGRSVLGLGGLRVIKLKSGNSWIVSKNAQGKTIFLYLLKRTVKQRGRHVFERVRAMVDKEADKTLTDAMVFVVEAKKR